MALVCPLCNGLYKKEHVCLKCGNIMTDKGPVVNYLDDYSPYLLDDISNSVDGVEENCCLHLFFCQNCGYDKRIKVYKKQI